MKNKLEELVDDIQLIDDLGVDAICAIGTTSTLALELINRGFYEYEEWKTKMMGTLGFILREASTWTDEHIAKYIQSVWDTTVRCNGKSKPVSEWAFERQLDEIRRSCIDEIHEYCKCCTDLKTEIFKMQRGIMCYDPSTPLIETTSHFNHPTDVNLFDALTRLGGSLVMNGYYIYDDWVVKMGEYLAPILQQNTDMLGCQIEMFIRSLWNEEMQFHSESKRICEWAADLQAQEVERLHTEIDSLKHELTQVRGELAKAKDDLIQSQDKVIKLYEVINEYNENRYGSIVE